MIEKHDAVEAIRTAMDDESLHAVDELAKNVTRIKERGGKVMVVTGSGPNIHEGVTTLIAELIATGIVDFVTTSSAVVAHELAGSLDEVKRCAAKDAGFDADASFLPRGNVFEFTVMTDKDLAVIRSEMVLNEELIERGKHAPGNTLIKAAGNMAYPMGLRTELISEEIASVARTRGLPFEAVAGWGADEHTMIGSGARHGAPVLVSIPQLVGGGAVGINIADSISIADRCRRIMEMIDQCDVIIESAVALTQEIHDGPYECYTGHGIWSQWKGMPTTSLKNKAIYRIDLDPNLKRARDLELSSAKVQTAIDKGLPKTKLTGIPFRMEMSAFARHEHAHAIIGDIGEVWPVFATRCAELLGKELSFISLPQDSAGGKEVRQWIVDQVRPFDGNKMRETLATRPDSGTA
jgi:hypothetical protein